jgi:hypothetical protein
VAVGVKARNPVAIPRLTVLTTTLPQLVLPAIIDFF